MATDDAKPWVNEGGSRKGRGGGGNTKTNQISTDDAKPWANEEGERGRGGQQANQNGYGCCQALGKRGRIKRGQKGERGTQKLTKMVLMTVARLHVQFSFCNLITLSKNNCNWRVADLHPNKVARSVSSFDFATIWRW